MAAASISNENSDEIHAYAEAALTESKQQGLLLAVKARWIALAIIAVLLPIVNFTWDVIYYHFLLAVFAFIGWAQLKVGKLGLSKPELALIFCDLILMTSVTVIPNPWAAVDWPIAMQYRYGAFLFFFVLLAGATLAYSWRTVFAFGTWTTVLWTIGLIWAYLRPNAQPELTEKLMAVWREEPLLAAILDPNSFNLGLRIQEPVVYLISAGILALMVKRSNELLRSHAASERERTNLARYFSPNVVEELSHNDEPLKVVRTQDVAVLFVDIVGFTEYSDGREPDWVIATLRQFHAAMEKEVFKHGGTLDKYLGDGLMATFGTPFTTDADASNALTCAQAMIVAVDALNNKNSATGEAPIVASFGLHYGPVVLGDIGANRLEFAVIGNTVNVASRLEALTRQLDCKLVVSEDLVGRVKSEADKLSSILDGLEQQPPQSIRGLASPIAIWTRSRA
jgi:adenylate cyclase